MQSSVLTVVGMEPVSPPSPSFRRFASHRAIDSACSAICCLGDHIKCFHVRWSLYPLWLSQDSESDLIQQHS